MYSKIYIPERYEELGSILTKIQSLEPGGKVELRGLGEETNRVRYQIYEWLYHMGLKKLFRLKQDLDTLTIRRLGLPTSLEVTTKSPGLPATLEVVLKELLMKKEKEVRDNLLDLVEKGELTNTESGLILDKWKEVME